jgi:hypothetical protein
MANVLPRRLVVLPGAVEHEEGPGLTPEAAVGHVLRANVHAPGLLSEARHRVIVARASEAATGQAARSCRDAELAHELARRQHDPRGSRSLGFWAAGGALAVLLIVACAVGLMLAWHRPWLDRATFAVAAAGLGAAVAWGASRRRGIAVWSVVAGVGAGALLLTLGALWTSGPVALRAAEAVAFGVALAAVAMAGVLVLERGENWQCYRSRRAHMLAARRRQELVDQASMDAAAADAAIGAWVSVVVEECQLAHPGDLDSADWVHSCASAARKIASPE